MNVMDIWLEGKRPTISFEFFPARDDAASDKLDIVIDKLAGLHPDFVSVTFGAGGSTREGSFQLANKLKKEKGLRVIPYLAAFGLNPENITSIVKNYESISIEGLLCVRGDEPEGDFLPHPDSFLHATDVIAHVGGQSQLMLGAAGYPEGHKEAESLAKDLEYLKLKVDKGAQFIISQYTYDNNYHYRFLEKCQQKHINVPILIGIMPIYSIKMMESLAKLCGATIPAGVRSELDGLPPDDKKAVSAYGIQYALSQCRDLLKHGVKGLHFYTMDRAKSVSRIVNQLRAEGLI